MYISDSLHKTKFWSYLPPATKLGQGNIFRRVCKEFCSGGRRVASQHALQVSRPTPRGGSWVVWPGGSPDPHPGGKLRSLAGGGLHPGGSQAHTQGVSQHALKQTPPRRQLLLQAVRILLKCILVPGLFRMQFPRHEPEQNWLTCVTTKINATKCHLYSSFFDFFSRNTFFVTQRGIFAVISLCSLYDTYRNDTCDNIHQWRLIFTMIFASGDWYLHQKIRRSILRSHLKVLQITQKTYFMKMFRYFDDRQMQPQNWSYYVWTS